MTFFAFLLLLAFPTRAQQPFAGENCQKCHAALRDVDPKTSVEAKPQDAGRYDVIVLGGGLSGLSAAHHLKDKKILLLEKEDRVGGKTRRETLGAWRFATGAVYTSKPYGIIAPMLRELRIYPRRLRSPLHNYWTRGATVEDWLSQDGLPRLGRTALERKALTRLAADLVVLESSGKLAIPIEESDPKLLASLDEESFDSYLRRRYGGRAAELGDHYAHDVFGVSSNAISAAVGLLYMSGEFSDSYNWPGGMGEIAEALGRELKDVVRTGALVEDVTLEKDSERVTFRQGGRRYEARASAVVVAIPGMVAKRVIEGLSDDKQAAMAELRYSVYAVVPMVFSKPVYQGSFVLWTPGMSFADLTFSGGDRLTGPAPAQQGQLAEAYLPLEEERAALLAETDDDLKDRVLSDLDKVLPGAAEQVVDSRVIRWGHAMPVIVPGYLTKIEPILRKPEGRLFFAGVETQVPAIEGAIYSGYYAAGQAREFLENAQTAR